MRRGAQWTKIRPSSSRQSRRGIRRQGRTEASDIYDELLEEALRQPSWNDERPLKKRKSQRDPSDVVVVDGLNSEEVKIRKENDVVVIDSSSNDASDDEDIEWDTVDLHPLSEDVTETLTSPVIREVTLASTPQKSVKKRVPTTSRNAVARQIRLEAHKMYLLTLLASFRHLNHLLSAPSLMKLLRQYVPPATINALNTGPEHTQARRTIAFLRGLKDIVSSWSEEWKETRRGWRRPRWVDSKDLGKIPAYLDLSQSISLEMLVEAARTKSGSRDVGAWLFTSLLRSVGVEARLVCSLQPLQFGFLNEGSPQDFYPTDPSQPSETIKIEPDKSHISVSSIETPPPTTSKPSSPNLPSSTQETRVYTKPSQYIAETKTFSPNYPFFWSEAWDKASQKWISVEPMVGARVNQPSRIEPPGTSAPWESGAIGDNILTYVIGFDNSGFAKDVTKRYAKAYHSKTWRHRIESQQGGEKWWSRIMKFLNRLEPLDRDQLEQIDLANDLLKEPIPKKIDDFRRHPLYVLERHLRRNEMLSPGAVHISGLTSGKGMNLKTEYVYKRKDVIFCYSAREWFRRGRIIKEGEQPVKHMNVTSRRRGSSSDENDDNTSTALYSEMQTELYVPPPVQNGIVPKNSFGNIDVYTPSMVPAGGVHIIRPSIAIAAQFSGIQYADAVTGFDFVRNKASPRLNGIVVAEENVDGLLAVWEGMMERVKGEEDRRNVQRILERWRRFFIKLGIRRRLDETHGKVENRTGMSLDEAEEDIGGGFLLGAVQDRQGIGAIVHEQTGYMEDVRYDMGGVFTDEGYSVPMTESFDNATPVLSVDGNGGKFPQSTLMAVENYQPSKVTGGNGLGSGFDPGDNDSEEGGFMQEGDGSDEGGFIYDDEDGIL